MACDCDLLWLVPWSLNSRVKLQPQPKCETPSPFKDVLLKKLKIGTDLHCDTPLQPLLELKPNVDQLLFEGDALRLRCRAPRVAVGAPRDSEDLPARAHIFWGWSNSILDPNSTADIFYQDPTKIFPSIEIDARHLSDSGLLDSILRIPYVTRNFSGTWDCRLRSQQANLSHSIAVIVVSEATEFCVSYSTDSNKGRYAWPQTIRGRTVRLPCTGDGPPNQFAKHTCSSDRGEWIDLNTNDCPYIRETTKVLEQFAKVNLSIARGSVVESAKRLRNYTDNDVRFYDPMDVVFIAKTVTNYLDFVAHEKDLGTMLLDIVSQVMELDTRFLQSAQTIDGSCTKLVQAAEGAAVYTPSPLAQKPNLALEHFHIRTDSFSGLTCTWYKGAPDDDGRRVFQCNTANSGQTIGIHERHIDAVIQIPNIFGAAAINSQAFGSQQQLLVSVFQTSKFFPPNRTQTAFEVTSCVIGAKVIGRPENSNLSDPIYIMLRAAPFHHDMSAPRPVWWDPELNDGNGGWSFQGCHFSQLLHGLLVFACNRLGYYGLLQNVKYLNDFRDEMAGARFRVSPPAFYIGGIVLFVCSWVNIVTYMAYGTAIQMAKRDKHSLVNTWLAMSLLCLTFTLGIYQTKDYKWCQTIGMAIHYFSLCVLLWVCVSVSNMYKRMSRHDRNLSLPTDDVPTRESIGQKPILGLYLVGWGIALIICGISAAVNIREYASYSYCFLRSGPALSAVFVPAGILIAFLAILFVCIKCSIRMPDDIGHMSEGTQGTENVDLDLMEPVILLPLSSCGRSHGNRSISLSTPTTTSQDDLEHSTVAQLKAHIIVLFLYAITWMSAAISVATPFSERFLYEEEVFSVIYAFTATILGLFLLFFYGLARTDVRQQWSLISCRHFSRRQCCRTRSVSDTRDHGPAITMPAVLYHQPTATGTLRSASRSSQSSKNRAATNSRGAAVDLNMQTLTRTDSPTGGYKMNGNVNLVLLHRQQFLHNSTIQSGSESADVFYNPNQINVARKFFKKQKRLQKRNNFEIQHRYRDHMDCVSEVSSVISIPRRHPNGFSIFASGSSKVNNTNIHLDKKNLVDTSSCGYLKETRQQNQNPNILSDSCNESDLIGEAERFVLGAENLRALTAKRAKVNNTPPIVANIYTNVPETAQPQHEIVTMRADDKYGASSGGTPVTLRRIPSIHGDNTSSDTDRSQFLIGAEKCSNSASAATTTAATVVAADVWPAKPSNIEPPHYVNEEFQQKLNVGSPTSTVANRSDVAQTSPSETCLKFDSGAMVLSLNSPILAMNTVGLPKCSLSPLQHADSIEISTDLFTGTGCYDTDLLKLDRDCEYISSALEIPNIDDQTYQPSPNSCDTMLVKSKSLNDLLSLKSNYNSEFDCLTQAASCTNVFHRPGAGVVGGFTAMEVSATTASTDAIGDKSSCDTHTLLQPGTSSPILFSPSLCDITDLPSPALSNQSFLRHQKPAHLYLESTPIGSETNLFFSPEKIFQTPCIGRAFISSSPTSESDINYQNSELSIRSHELYAPQQDNDLNLTLTGDENLFQYQASELSDYDDDDDNEIMDQDDDDDVVGQIGYPNCSNDCMLGTRHDDTTAPDILNESQSSIDELYQQITRRSISDGGTVPILQRREMGIGASAVGGGECEDDSSQCSIISYVEPANNGVGPEYGNGNSAGDVT